MAEPVGGELRRSADQTLADSGLRKVDSGGTPTHREIGAIERVERAQLADHWQKLLHAPLPKKYLSAATGRQIKVLNEQAVRYGLPIGGATWKLGETLNGIWDFIARSAPAISRFQDSNLDWDGEQTPALERLRMAKAQIEELNLAEKRRHLIDRRSLRDAHTLYAGMLRSCGEQLRKHYGEEAAELLNEAISAGQRAMSDVLTVAEPAKAATPPPQKARGKKRK